MFLTSEIMPSEFNKRQYSTLNAINCTNIECHGVPPFGFQNMQTDLNKFSSVANNESIHLFSQCSTNGSPTDLLELESTMIEVQSETAFILSFLNGAIQRPLSYENHIMNQKLACAKKKIEKSCLLAYKVYCDMELKHNLLVMQCCNDEMILCSKAYDHHCYPCKPSNENHSTFDYDDKKTCETNIVFDGLQDLRCIMAPDYYPDRLQYIFPTPPIESCFDSVNIEGVRLLLSLCHCRKHI
jgi:hypothetical protein